MSQRSRKCESGGRPIELKSTWSLFSSFPSLQHHRLTLASPLFDAGATSYLLPHTLGFTPNTSHVTPLYLVQIAPSRPFPALRVSCLRFVRTPIANHPGTHTLHSFGSDSSHSKQLNVDQLLVTTVVPLSVIYTHESRHKKSIRQVIYIP